VEVLAAIRRGDTRVIIATEDTALVDLLCRGLHRNVRDVEAPSFKCFLALGEEFVSLIASSQILWRRLELQRSAPGNHPVLKEPRCSCTGQC
jgi:hypothetical protein